MPKNKPIAFVIMPFSPEFNGVFEELIVPALNSFEVIRADTRLDQRSIMEKVIAGIAEAELVVADITTVNANVMYELGIAHTLDKPTVMIAQALEDLPFDVRSYPVYEYSVHFQRATELRTRLKELGIQHLQRLVRFANPVTDFLPSATSAIARRAVTELPDKTNLAADEDEDKESEAEEEPEDYGYVDFAADMEEHGGAAVAQMGRLAELTAELTKNVNALAPAMQHARASSDPGSAAQQKLITNQLATILNDYSRALDDAVVPAFHASWKRVGNAMLWLLRHDDATVALSDEVAPLREMVAGLHDVLSDGVTRMTSFRETVPMMHGHTRDLNRAAERVDASVGRVMNEFILAMSYLSRIQEHLDVIATRPSGPC